MQAFLKAEVGKKYIMCGKDRDMWIGLQYPGYIAYIRC